MFHVQATVGILQFDQREAYTTLNTLIIIHLIKGHFLLKLCIHEICFKLTPLFFAANELHMCASMLALSKRNELA